MRETQNLSGVWRFQPDPAREGEALGYTDPAYDDTFWRQVRLPAGFEDCHPQLRGYVGGAWFRRTFDVPGSWRGRRVVLWGDGVRHHVRLWLNGRAVGEHHDGLLPFAFDVQDAAKFDAANVLAMWVEATPHGSPGPGGPVRDVGFLCTDPLHLGHVHVSTGAEGHLALCVEVRNARSETRVPEVRVRVLEGEKLLARLAASGEALSPGAATEVTLEGHVPGTQPWSPHTPALYDLAVDLCVAGQVVDSRTLRTGFRNVTVRDGALLLNDEALFLTGFNYHEATASPGLAVDAERVRRDLEAMKDAGATFVRLTHAPHHPLTLDLCDELGLVAMAEIPLYAPGDEAGVQATFERQLRAAIARDAHHPAIFFWSLRGVVPAEVDLRPWLREAKRLDPARLAVHTAHVEAAADFDADDVVCVHAHPAGPVLSQDATAAWREKLAALHARHPGKPLLVTAFGVPSLQDVWGGVYGEDTHAASLEHAFAGMDAPYVCGAAVWCWADADAADPSAVGSYAMLGHGGRLRVPLLRVRELFREREGLVTPPASPVEPTAAGYKVLMLRPDLNDIPDIPFPQGFRARSLRPDEGGLWRDLWRDAEPYFPIGEGLFENQFGYDPQAVSWRCYFVVNEKDVAVGTISAWYNHAFRDGDWGQIHWVALRPAYWGKGLARPMLAYALQQMAQWHERAFLSTQTKRLRAIKLYLNLGFVPDMGAPGAVDAWREVAAQLEHPALERLTFY